MKIKTGYIYHLKDDFFRKVNDKGLMKNHENGHSRPTYFTIKDKNLLWFIPLSSKVDKYKKIIDYKAKKYGECKTILIRKIGNKDSAILLQNAFPLLEKYIDHPHIVNGKPLKVINTLKEELLSNFKYMQEMKKNGKNLFFVDIDKITKVMYQELQKDTGKNYGLIDITNRNNEYKIECKNLFLEESENILNILNSKNMSNYDKRISIDNITNHKCLDINTISLEEIRRLTEIEIEEFKKLDSIEEDFDCDEYEEPSSPSSDDYEL